MRPVPVPEELVWGGARRMVVVPPEGMEEWASPVEAVITEEDGLPCFYMLVRVEEEDFRSFERAPFFWLAIYGTRLSPFGLTRLHETHENILRGDEDA